MSRDYEKLKTYYRRGLWNEAMLRNAVAKGRITEEEYRKIVDGEA